MAANVLALNVVVDDDLPVDREWFVDERRECVGVAEAREWLIL